MGLFKKIKKAISKVVKAPLKAVGLAADAPNVQTAAETPVAAPQEAPKEVVEDVESSSPPYWIPLGSSVSGAGSGTVVVSTLGAFILGEKHIINLLL